MKKSLTLLISMVIASAAPAATQAAAPKLVKKWETEATLKVPESVYFDAKRKVLYVSNIDGEPWGDDKKGSIGKVGLDGKVVAAEWITGLSAPKGMAVHGNQLYVGDMSNVVVIDLDKGAVAKRISVPGAQGLNDVAVTPDGVLYVSDSPGKKVFTIKDGKPSLFLDNLKGPNGLLFHRGELLVADGTGAHKVGKDGKLAQISGGMEGVLDGLEPISENEYLLSTWQGTIYYIGKDGSNEVILDTRDQKINAADIGYDPEKRIVYVPTFFKNSVVAYELK
jgi:DNA-binding beta-propeller fold protein YncE